MVTRLTSTHRAGHSPSRAAALGRKLPFAGQIPVSLEDEALAFMDGKEQDEHGLCEHVFNPTKDRFWTSSTMLALAELYTAPCHSVGALEKCGLIARRYSRTYSARRIQ